MSTIHSHVLRYIYLHYAIVVLPTDDRLKSPARLTHYNAQTISTGNKNQCVAHCQVAGGPRETLPHVDDRGDWHLLHRQAC